MSSTTEKSWLYRQLLTNWQRFEVFYVTCLILVQILVFAIVPDSPIGMLAGIMGVLCLVYGMKGRKISFLFGFIQCCAMTWVAWVSHAYGSFAIDIVYIISQPIGWYLWGRAEVTRTFPPQIRRYIFLGAFIAWFIGWQILAQIGGQLPYFDSINFVVSLIAQLLYVLKYTENWSLWIVVNVSNIIYWSILAIQTMMGYNEIGSLGDSLSQVALQGALLFNSVYATKVWASGGADYEGGTEKA